MARKKRREQDVPARMKRKGIEVSVLGGGLLVASLVVSGSSNPILKAAASGFSMPVPWVLGLGAVLWGIGHLLQRQASIRPSDGGAPQGRQAVDPWPRDRGDPPGGRATPREASPPRAAEPAAAPRPAAAGWSAQVFHDIEWKRFETLCARLFGQAGFEARTQSHGADGGVDIWLHSRHASGPVSVVQCKHWPNKQVGVKEMRELLGVMTANKLARATFATSGTFSAEALAFAQANRIHTLDAAGLLGLIAQRTPAQQQELLAHAYEGDYARPTCASCGRKLVERTPRQGGRAFWGCPAFPGCRFTLPMRNT